MMITPSHSDEEVLAGLRCVAIELGRRQFTSQEYDAAAVSIEGTRRYASSAIVRRRFGSWREGLRRAGLSDV